MVHSHLPTGNTSLSSEPVEYKDAPLRFTFVIDGREEPVKIVHPKIDLPFPDGALLQVEEDERPLCEVTFHLDKTARQPYRLILKMPARHGSWETTHFSYGDGLAPESEMTAVYRKTILKRGNVQARIAMTRRKARLQIDYQGGRRIPPQSTL